MEEVKEPQVEPGTPGEKAEQLEPTEQPQPQIEELNKELERKEAEIKRLQGIVKDAQKRGVPKEEINALHKKIDDMQDWFASVSDDLASRIGGDFEEPKSTKKTYRQQLDEKRAQAKPEEPKIDPDVQKFIKYLDSLGLDYDDPLVKDAVAEERNPQEALKYLKDKVKGQSQAEVDKRAEEIADRKVEQKLKDLHLTDSGPSGPSGPASSWRDKTPEEKLLLGVTGKK